MRRIFGRVVAAGVIVLCTGVSGDGQDPRAEPGRSGQTRKPKPLYFGVSTCADCHNRDKPLVNKDLPPLCPCTEMRIWQEQDKHRDAYLVLLSRLPNGAKNAKGERAERMGKLLGVEDVSKDRRCLACHSVNVLDPKQLSTSFRREDGVGCVVCHGAYEDWIDDHGSAVPEKRQRWRHYPRVKKQAEYGMTDLWNPVTRTQACVSCHVGSVPQGRKDVDQVKFVTHEMYAAGHPPLPGIEVATFSEQMPRHWQLIRQKDEDVQKLLGFRPGSEKFENTKLVVVSSVTTLAQTMHLLAAQAGQCATPRGGNEAGLDFANFDCYACHHDLKMPSWRQRRGYVGKPGRPQMRPWPTELAKIVVRVVRPDDSRKLEGGLADLYQAFGAKPYGDCAAIAAAAGELAKHLTNTGDELNRQKTPRYQEWAPKLLAALVSIKEIPDYDSARQIAWALEILLRDCGKDDDPQVKRVLNTLKENLKLTLPAGQKKSIEEELPESLRKLNDYRPDEFMQALRKLAELPTKLK